MFNILIDFINDPYTWSKSTRRILVILSPILFPLSVCLLLLFVTGSCILAIVSMLVDSGAYLINIGRKWWNTE